MKKLKRFWQNIPRPYRAALNIFLSLTLMFLIWYCNGSPLLTVEQEFRRAEKANLVGPSTIVDQLTVDDYSEFDHTIVAETEEGVIFYGIHETWNDTFSYRKKTGDITLAVPPTTWFNWGGMQWDLDLPIYIFHEYPEADLAELELYISGVYEVNYNGTKHSEEFERSYVQHAPKQEDGFFLFHLQVPSKFDQQSSSYIDIFEHTGLEDYLSDTHGPEGYALQLLSELCNSASLEEHMEDYALATVRLYDANDNLIVERELTIRSVAAEAHAERNELQEVQDNEN